MYRTSHAIAALTLTALAGTASAQNYIGETYGDWSFGANWDSGTAPVATSLVTINNNSVVNFDMPLVNASQLVLGWGASEFGHLIVGEGAIQTTVTSIGFDGQGILEMLGTGYFGATGFKIGSSAGSSGFVGINGGTLNCTQLSVGHSGSGELSLEDGLAKFSLATLGVMPGGFGTFVQTGGEVDAGQFRTDYNGEGAAWFSGGVADMVSLEIGLGTGGSISPMGLANVSGTASLSMYDLMVGVSDAGRFEMTGGSLYTGDLFAQYTSTGYAEISLEGGYLHARRIKYFYGAPPSFMMTGGVLACETFGEPSNPWDLIVGGGTIHPHADDMDYLSVRGALVLGAPAAMRFQLDNPGSSDDVTVTGDVTLQGSLELQIEGPINAGDTFLLIDNQSANPVLGSFAGLAEGGTVNAVFGAFTYSFEITYVGGDGNDVYLVMTSCPPDINNDGVLDGGDLSAFVDLFLAGDLLTDFTGDGFLDSGDITAFIDAFLAGCP